MKFKLRNLRLIIAVSFLLAGVVMPAPATTIAQGGEDQKEDTVEALEAMGKFATFVDALKRAGLADELKKPGRFSVCAPTDNVFAALPSGALDALIKDSEKLRGVLLSNFVYDELKSVQPTEKKVVVDKGLEDTPVALICNPAKRAKIPAFDGATAIEYNFESSNGVIRVIDVVLMRKK
jgi:transforming growth factor-beta-induced protein